MWVCSIYIFLSSLFKYWFFFFKINSHHISLLNSSPYCFLGETPFRCSYCPKAFTRKDHLVNHVRQHTGESPHKCTYCTKSFTRKEHLNNHVRQHTGESPHRCHFCSKSFTRKEHLTNHVRIHTGKKWEHKYVDIL